MDNNLNFETFLFVSKKKFIISVDSETNEKIYIKELILEQNSEENILNKLDLFLNENILKIEKELKNFIKKIILIFDSEKFYSFDTSIKKDNYENILNLKVLNHLLYGLKDSCKDNLLEKKIIHMTIQNYLIDNKEYDFFPENIKCNSFSITVNFDCLSNEIIKNFETILKKYQISLKQIVNANYIRKFFGDNEKEIFVTTKKIINGHNPNEVLLIDKITKNKGFFEKFFSFFS